MKKSLALLALAASTAITTAVWADDSVSQGIAKYREMLQDGNPAELFEMNGEELWTTKRGPKNASLEQCDLGKGPGVVEGAFVELPRYFADTGRVQDLESRLLTCMETLQGFDAADVEADRSVELQRVTTGGGFGATEHHARPEHRAHPARAPNEVGEGGVPAQLPPSDGSGARGVSIRVIRPRLPDGARGVARG